MKEREHWAFKVNNIKCIGWQGKQATLYASQRVDRDK